MSDEPGNTWIIDCYGLYEIARMSGNIKSVFLEKLQNGHIRVPSRVWKEFTEIYEEEAEILKPHVPSKIRTNRKYTVGAARIAEKLNSGFSGGAYENYTDIQTASIATIDGYTIITSTDQISIYEKMGCEAVDLEQWLSEHGD